jgi:3-oxoacyl-[acyl-carrier protein] reductase
MKQQNYGKIINISSSSIFPGNPVRIHYVTSKAGIIGFSRSLARALGEYNICVNSVLPGSTASEGALAAYDEAFWERGLASRSLKRVQQPEDMVGTIVFLASSDSDFITGQAITVDGGSSMY